MPAPEGSISETDRQSPEDSPKSWSHFFHVVEALALILAIAAIYYEGLHANELLKEVGGLAANMSTQYVADFPNSLGPISEELNKVCGTIDAMVDVAGYGFYSEPGGFDKYYEAIAKSASKDLKQRLETPGCANSKTDLSKELKLGQPGELKHPTVRMIFFSPDDRILSVHQQLKDLGRRAGMHPDEVGVFKAFAEKNKSLINRSEADEMVKAMNTPAGYHAFRVLLQRQLCEIEKDLRSNEVEVRYAKDQFITRWWLIDRKRAVFSFDHKAITESTFKSSDYQMLKNFNSIFDSWWRDSVPYSVYWDLKKKDHGASIADMPSGEDQDDPVDDVKGGSQSCIDIIPDLISSAEKKGK
jgi:hypothetical protein